LSAPTWITAISGVKLLRKSGVEEVLEPWWVTFRTANALTWTWLSLSEHPEAGEAHLDLINHNWRDFLKGLLLTSHRGMWFSYPEATERASVKLWQLQKAA
jgi:hypothetical protein